jgi:UTP--glucose-1-phosphate uridylyltransferase
MAGRKILLDGLRRFEMTLSGRSKHLPAFLAKMKGEKLPPVVIDTFARYYSQVISGATGFITDHSIEPVASHEIKDASEISAYAQAGAAASKNAIQIALNGGLGTSMGLTGAKSLLIVKDGLSFLDIIIRQALRSQVRLCFMNSFNTDKDTRQALAAMDLKPMPYVFTQHKFPKILQDGFAPPIWPANRNLEWNPPGHGDVYTALYASGLLDKLIGEGIGYALIHNSDNLGATMDHALLGYFVKNRFPFMMEVARRTPSDRKGGHLAKRKDGRLVLREAAQCPPDEMEAFTDIARYRFFNANNVWINLDILRELIRKKKVIELPLIVNPKTLDPRDANSPPVFQVETAMGAAISLFEGASAIQVSASRFLPVKKCDDLMAVMSDCYVFSEQDRLIENPARQMGRITIKLDPNYYGKIDQFNRRFPFGAPSLVDCRALTISGDVRFENNIIVKRTVKIINTASQQKTIPAGTIIDTDMVL